MKTLSSELRGVIASRLQSANLKQVLAIASALCAQEIEVAVPTQTSPRFTAHGDIVQDNTTGLMWTRWNVPGGRMDWSKAKEAAAASHLGGYTDWRLPTIQELLSIVKYERFSPAIDTSVFECESAWYWSATPYASSPAGCAWYVHFYYGDSGWSDQDYGGFVRAVRAGQLFGTLG